MRKNTNMKKRRDRRDDTIFKIDNTNRGQIDLERFNVKSDPVILSGGGNKNNRRMKNKSSVLPDRSDRSDLSALSDLSDSNKRRLKNNKSPIARKKVVRIKEAGKKILVKESVGLRVVGGKFRGSRLLYSGDNRVRPMKDRVREAVFNLIGPVIRGKRVIDLFGGTGALAIEAMSRGAIGGVVIEMHLPTAMLLRKNLESLNLLGDCQLCKTDAFFWAKNRQLHPQDDISWIVFCSPPYSFYVERSVEVLAMLDNLLESAPVGSVFVIESDNRFDFNLLPVKPAPNKIRSYPPAEIAIFVKEKK
ncbi:MAG: RsmD family RNA methyltransferase [Planctomycetaceae bacterium]|nr:RsmD family RNA methyltransferase [Planctomycetaceae bacterium]